MYKIIRRYFNESVRPRTMATGLSLEQAQAWCKDPETSSQTCVKTAGKARTRKCGPWFDGYTES
jgi:hypothetical protein